MTTNKSSSPSSLPIVDLSLPDEQASLQLGKACRTIGFFILVNHGIPPELIKTVFKHSSLLFNNMSQEAKQHHAIRKDNRGYSSFATEKLDPTSKQKDNKECFNFVPDNNDIAEYCAEKEEERGDSRRCIFFDDFRNPLPEEKILLSNNDDAENTTSIKNELAFRWPSEKEGAPKDLRKVMLTYINEVMKVSDRLHRLIAMDLKLENPVTFFQPFFQNPMATLRLLHYPQEEDQQEQQNQDVGDDGKNTIKLAAGEHTDYDSLTFLVTDSTPGLQVRDRETNEWIDAPTLPKDALGEYIIVNIADCLMRWTNDLYKSTPHRVLQPTQERYSCALFVGPQGRTKIKALPGTGEAKYEETTAFEHLMMKLGMTYQFLKQRNK